MKRPALTHVLVAAGLAGVVAVPVVRSGATAPTPQVVAEADTSIRQVELPTNMDAAGLTVGRAVAQQIAAKKAAAEKARLAAAAAERRKAAERRASRARRAAATAPVSYGSPRAIAKAQLAARGWSDQFGCLDRLWQRESGWNTYASNPSGAYGIPQALPGSKMATAGSDWRTNPATQIRWGLGYIGSRYGGPCAAWSHSQSTGWY
jgi:hypothetical protein